MPMPVRTDLREVEQGGAVKLGQSHTYHLACPGQPARVVHGGRPVSVAKSQLSGN